MPVAVAGGRAPSAAHMTGVNENGTDNVVSVDMAKIVIERDALLATIGAVPAGHPHAFRFPTDHDAAAAASLISTMCPRLHPEETPDPRTIRVEVSLPTENLVAADA